MAETRARWTAVVGLLMAALTQETSLAALRDPAYHRYLLFGATDAARERQTGRALESHEAQARLPWPQLAIVQRVERAVAARQGEVITIRCARQTGKNETEAFLEDRALSIFRSQPGSVWVRIAPTWKPQIVNSKLRLEKHLACDPLLRGRVRPREGYIFESGHAQVQFLSGGTTAHIVGATASIALSVDEAHKIDRGKFEEDIAPFTASTAAPTVLWGVAADELDLLHEYVDYNRGSDRALDFPAEVWCDLSKAYAAHYESRVAKLGADHPVILTQYRLIAVAASGSYLNAALRTSLFSGDHPRLSGPRDGMSYALLVDVGGESEVDLDDAGVRDEEPGRDSTMAWVVEWDPAAPSDPWPMVRIVDGHWWTGRAHMSVAPELVALFRHWGCRSGVIDARGVGEAVAGAVHRELPAVIAYKATAADVSADCYDLEARLHTGRVHFWRADPAADAERREMEAQARHTAYAIHGHELKKLMKPTGVGSSDKHIDGVKALTYLRHVLSRFGIIDYYRAEAAKVAGGQA